VIEVDDTVEFQRSQLDEHSWIDVARGWLHGADELYAFLESNTQWYQDRVWRYEKWVESPRMTAGYSAKTTPTPVIVEAQRAIEKRYNVGFDGFGLQYYRNARDSVAMHRDREMTWLDDTVVAILTTGAQRPFLVQPRAKDRSHAFDISPASGDLMVFGGRFQADWLHGVPRSMRAVRGRISVQWRYTSKRGRRDTQPTYYDRREFSKR
jgi:alkylated DNA repair dioxygenase AlkB